MVDLEIHDLEGIGPTLKKLNGVGRIETQAVPGRDIQHRCRYNQPSSILSQPVEPVVYNFKMSVKG